jgi:hypothetical protein
MVKIKFKQRNLIASASKIEQKTVNSCEGERDNRMRKAKIEGQFVMMNSQETS